MENEEKNIDFATQDQKEILASLDSGSTSNVKIINPLDEPLGILDGVDDPDPNDPLTEYNHRVRAEMRMQESWNKPMIQAAQNWINTNYSDQEIADANVDPEIQAQMIDKFLSDPAGKDFGWDTRKNPGRPFPQDPTEKPVAKKSNGDTKDCKGIPGSVIDTAQNTFTPTIVGNFQQALKQAYAGQAASSGNTVAAVADDDDDDSIDSTEGLSDEEISQLDGYLDQTILNSLKQGAHHAVSAQKFTQEDIDNSKYTDLFDATVNFLKNTLGKRLMIVAGGPGLGKSYTIADAVDTVMNGGAPGYFKRIAQTGSNPVIQAAIPTSGGARGKKDRFLYRKGGENFELKNFISWMFAHRANYCCVFDDADKYLITKSGACQNLLKGWFGDGDPEKVEWTSEMKAVQESNTMSFDTDKLQEQGILDVYKDDKLIASEVITSRKELRELCEEFGGKPTKEALENARKLEEAAGTALPDDDDDVDFDASAFDPNSDDDANIGGNGVTNAAAEDEIDDMFEEEEAAFKASTAKGIINRIPSAFAFSSRIMFITNASERKLNSDPNSSAVYQRSYHVNMDLTKPEFMARLKSIMPHLGGVTKKSHGDTPVEAAKRVVFAIYAMVARKPEELAPFIFAGDDEAFTREGKKCRIDGLVINAMSFRVFESLVNSLTIQIGSAIAKNFADPAQQPGEEYSDYLSRLGMAGVRYNNYQWFKSQVVPCFKYTFKGIKKGEGDV